MFEQEKDTTDELLLRELFQAIDKEIAEFRRLKDGVPGGSESSAEPMGASTPELGKSA